MASKVARCRPDLYSDAEITIWLDASARLNPDSVEQLVEALGDSDIAQFIHPDRSDIGPEADFSLKMRKYHGHPLDAQVAHYRSAGFPVDFGLWACGCIVRRNTAQMRDFGNAWLLEMMRWSWQDQISEPFVLWSMGIRPTTLPGDLWSNPIVGFNYDARPSDDWS